MRCPKCGELASEGAAICQNCNEILDPSFLEGLAEDDEEVEGDRTDVGPAPTAASASAVKPLRPPRPTALRPSAARGNWSSGKAAPSEAPAQADAPGPRQLIAVTKPAQAPDALGEAARSVDDLKELYASLSLPDRWAAGSAVAMLVTLFLPWRWTKTDEELIGFVEAWPVLILGAAALACLYLRARAEDPKQRAPLQLGQLGAALLATLFAGNSIRVFSDAQVARLGSRTIELVVSAPRLGVWAGLACAAALLLASIASSVGGSQRS